MIYQIVMQLLVIMVIKIQLKTLIKKFFSQKLDKPLSSEINNDYNSSSTTNKKQLNRKNCFACNAVVYLGSDAFSYGGEPFCQECLCGTCGKPFNEKSKIKGHENKNYCQECVCSTCNRSIQGSYVPVGDSKYCLNCVCHFCRGIIKKQKIFHLCVLIVDVNDAKYFSKENIFQDQMENTFVLFVFLLKWKIIPAD